MARRSDGGESAIFDIAAIVEIPRYGLLIAASARVRYNDLEFPGIVEARERYNQA
jgi:hypothetical protein